MGSSKDTLFQSGGGSGQGAGDYVQDFFDDATVEPTNNTGLTSTASTNPLGRFLANTDFPRYEYKTLWIQRLIPLEQKDWIQSKPTFEIEFSEKIPGVYAYAYGDIRLRNTFEGLSVDVNQIDDGIGICGVARRVQFIVNPVADTTATADILVDGADTGSDVTFGSQTFTSLSGTQSPSGWNRWHAVRHGTSNETENIHDYRLTANQVGLLNLGGFTVYFENSGQNIAITPGSTYVSKTKETTSSVTTMAVPAVTGPLGSNVAIYKTASNTYANTSNTIPTIFSAATGTSGTNLVTVTTGHGSSFPIGSGVVALAGSSFYIGSVTNVSTDTLTVSPTLAVALAGATFYKAWLGNASLAIGASYYTQGANVDFGQMWNIAQLPGLNSPADFGGTTKYFSGLNKEFRVWGQNITGTAQNGYYGLGFVGASGSLNFEFYGAALSVELSSLGAICHGTFSVNGVPAWGLNQGLTGIQRFTVFGDSGPQWHQVAFYPGASMSNAVAFKSFQPFQTATNQAQTTGLLASYDNLMAETNRTAVNATLIKLGTHKRYFADDLYLTGGWSRGATVGAAGGIQYIGASTNCTFRFEYFGQNFALLGTASSMAVLFDGASIATQFGTGYSIGTMGHHIVSGTVTGTGMTAVIQGIDVIRPRDDVDTLQKFQPRQELDDAIQVFAQSNTPRNPKNGDIWAENASTGFIWVYLFGRWNRLRIDLSVDDPNAPAFFIRAIGSSSGNTAANGQSDAESYNFISWSTISGPGFSGMRSSVAEAKYNGRLHLIDYLSTGGSTAAANSVYNRITWSAETNRGSNNPDSCVVTLLNNLYTIGGFNGGSGTTAVDIYSGVTWSGGAGVSGTGFRMQGFTQGGKWRVIGGVASGPSYLSTHRTFDGTTTTTDTAVPTAAGYALGALSAGGARGIVGADFTGTSATNSYEWNGTSWSSSISMTTVINNSTNAQACGYNRNTGNTYVNGGNNGGPQSFSQKYNAVSWSNDVSSSVAREFSTGAII